MNFNEVKCKFCGASINITPGTKEVTCSTCYNSFKLDDQPMTNNQGTNLPNPFASLESTNNPNINSNMNSAPNIPNNQNGFNNQMMNMPSNQNMSVPPTGFNNQMANMPTNPEMHVPPAGFNNQIMSMPEQQPKVEQPMPMYTPPVNNMQNTQINKTPETTPPPAIVKPQDNSNKTEQKKKKKKKKNIKKIILYILFIGIIIGSAVVWYLDYTKPVEEPEIYEKVPSEIIVEEKDKSIVNIEDLAISLAPDVDLNQERAKYNNNEIIGRLEIPGLFNVLVAKANNNEFYLSHDVSRKSDIRGTEFMDYRNNPNDKQVNIYGHNTRDINIKVAFLKLEQYLNKEFFDANRYIIFQHDGGKAVYKIIVMKEIRNSNREHMIVNKVGAEFVEHVRNMTTGEGVMNVRDVPYDENSNIIVLQTCSHHWDNGFYTLIGVKIRDL